MMVGRLRRAFRSFPRVLRLAADCDTADAGALRGHMATRRPTLLTANP